MTRMTEGRGDLSRLETRWARAAFGAIFPAAPELGFPLGICDMELERFLAETRAAMPWLPALGLRFAIWFVALAPIIVLRRFVTLAGLAESQRAAVVATLSTSRSYLARQMVLVLKATGAPLSIVGV